MSRLNKKNGFQTGHTNQSKSQQIPPPPQCPGVSNSAGSVDQPSNFGEDHRPVTRNSPENQYAVINLSCLSRLTNLALKNHPAACCGPLIHEISENFGISVKMIIYCKSCTYTSDPEKMYDEINSSQVGRKQSTLNLALGTAVQSLPINGTNVIHLFTSIGVIPPSHRGLQMIMNKSNGINTLIGQKAINRQVEITKKRIRKRKCGAHLSTDDAYNNGMFSSQTPTHAATQAYTTVLDCQSGKILHHGVHTKQCHRGALLRNKGLDVECGTGTPHQGGCSANMSKHDPIGCESARVRQAAQQLELLGVDAASWTKDGDGTVTAELLAFYEEKVIEILQDERHLNNSFKNKMRKVKFSKDMLKGRTVKIRNVELRNFTEDIANRCYTEIKLARKAITKKSRRKLLVDGEKTQFVNSLNKTANAVLRCIKNDHSLCVTDSFICDPLEGETWNFSYLTLPADQRQLTLTPGDEAKLTELLEMRLGAKTLYLLWRGTSTQRNESFNRKLRKHLPKNTNFTKNAAGRCFNAVAHQNEGFANATIQIHNQIGFQTSLRI